MCDIVLKTNSNVKSVIYQNNTSLLTSSSSSMWGKSNSHICTICIDISSVK